MNRRRGLVAVACAAGMLPQVAPAAGDPRQLFDRALALLCGRGGAPDPQAAAALLEQAATQGHAGAQGLLGWMAMSGTGMPRDEARAARWLRPAAEAGDSAAQNNLGVLHAMGQGVPHDHAEAERWFRAAAARGAEDAERNLKELLRPARPGDAAPPRTVSGRLHPALAAAGCRAPRT